MQSTTSNTKPTVKNPPASWTDDQDELSTERFPGKECQMGPARMVLYNNALSTYPVECDDKYFLWNEISDGIDQVVEPTKLEDIYKVLPDASHYKTPDCSKLKLVALGPR